MRGRIQFLLFAAVSLVVVSGLIVVERVRQRDTVAELMKHEFVAVQFSDGEYCESLDEVQQRNWLFDSLDVVYFDVPEGSSRESLALLRQLSSLTRVIVRFQGDSFEEYRERRDEIEQRIEAERALVKSAIPNVEVLSVSTVVQSEG